MLIVWILGLMLAVHLNVFGQLWFTAKLLLVVILTGYQGWIGRQTAKNFAGGHREPSRTRSFSLMNELPGILTAFIVVFVIVKPF